MRIVIQLVSQAKVSVGNATIGQIEKGLLLLVGIAPTDTEAVMDVLLEKLINLRIFGDADNKMNLSLLDCKGSLLVVSQFTLYADCKKGRRPGFSDAGAPEFANEMYKKFIQKCESKGIHTEQGEFGAHMKVELINDGPVTIILDSKDFSL